MIVLGILKLLEVLEWNWDPYRVKSTVAPQYTSKAAAGF